MTRPAFAVAVVLIAILAIIIAIPYKNWVAVAIAAIFLALFAAILFISNKHKATPTRQV